MCAESTQVSDLELQAVKKRTVSGAISYFIRTGVLQGVGLASAFVLSAFLSPAEFGIYAFVIQIIGLLVFFSDIGLAASLIQKKTEPSNIDYQTAFVVQQALSWVIVGLVVLLVSTGWVQAKTGQPGVWVLLALAVSFPLATLKTIPSIILERQLKFSRLVLPQIVEQVLFHSILIWLAWKGLGVMSYAYAILARSLAGVIVMTWLQPWPFGWSFSRKSLKELLGFGVRFQVNDILARIKDQLFYLVLGAKLLPLTEFGYVNWAKNWSVYPYNLTVQNVMAITFPTFSRLQGHPAALRKAIEKSIYFITISIFPLLVGMSVFIWPLVSLVEKYHKWQPALLSLVLFSLSIGWSAVSTPLTNTLNAVGQINTTLKLMVLWTGLTWLITPALLWWLGFNGVAASALLISFTSLLPAYYVKRQVVDFDLWDQVWRQLLAAGVMATVGFLGQRWWSMGFGWLLFGMAVTGLSYLVALWLVGRQKLVAEIQSLRR